jgi:CheY-like chemotaxis protein
MNKHHILIVEDQRDLARMLQAGLKSMGAEYQVITVPSGEEALLVIRSQPIDLVVLDVVLPGISGLTLLERLRQQRPSIKAIVITGIDDHEVRKRVANAGAEAFFFKPIEFTDLMEAVRYCLDPQPVPMPPLETSDPLSEEDDPQADTVSNRLSTLRQELEAVSVVLLDDRGEPMVQAGDFPEGVEKEILIPALMAVFSAAEKVSHVLGAPVTTDLFNVSGKDYTLHMTHVGGTYALLIFLENTPDAKAFSRVAAVLPGIVPELLGSLADMGVPVDTGQLAPEPEPEAEPEPEPLLTLEEAAAELPDLDNLFQQAAVTELSSEEVDAFWAPPKKSIDTGSLHADDLTYDQARKLGFTPDDE